MVYTVCLLRFACSLEACIPVLAFFGKMPRFACSLSTVGQAGTVKIKNDTMPKLGDCDVHCLFVGYLLTHPSESYRMYYLKMHRVHISCIIICTIGFTKN